MQFALRLAPQSLIINLQSSIFFVFSFFLRAIEMAEDMIRDMIRDMVKDASY